MGMRAEPLEKDIQKDILQYLHIRGFVAWRQNQGAASGEHNGKKRFFRFCSMPGISDVLGIIPPEGLFLAVEVKRPGKKPSLEQQMFLDTVRLAGGIAIVATSVDDVIHELERRGR